MRRHVGGAIVVHRGGRRSRAVDVGHRRQRIELDRDVGERVLGDVAAIGDDHGEGLAHVPHFVPGERHLGALVERDAGDRRRWHQQGSGLPIIAEVGRRIDRDHAGAAERGGRIDPPDACMRHRAAQERRVQEVGKIDIVDEQRPAAQQPRILVAPDRGAEIAGRHAGSAAASLMPASMGTKHRPSQNSVRPAGAAFYLCLEQTMGVQRRRVHALSGRCWRMFLSARRPLRQHDAAESSMRFRLC